MSQQEVLPPERKRALAPREESLTVERNTVALLNKSEIDQQIATAHAYPRSIQRFREEAMALVSLDEAMARACIYAIPRDGKIIQGPSARFAEILISTWGNCRAGARVVNEGDDYITAQGVFHDLERNSAITYEVQRRITNKEGRRFGADMIGVTANAACSIALRNAALKGVPKAFWAAVYEAALATIAGDFKTLTERRKNALKAFADLGVKAKQVYTLLVIKGEQDIQPEHLITLSGLLTAIKEGETTVAEAFPRTAPRADPKPEPETAAAGEPIEGEAEETKEPSPDETATQPLGALARMAAQQPSPDAANATEAPVSDGQPTEPQPANTAAAAPQQSVEKAAAPQKAKPAVMDSGEPFSNDETDEYLKGLAERFKDVKTLDEAEQVWTGHKIFEGRIFPPDRPKAQKLYADAKARVTKTA